MSTYSWLKVRYNCRERDNDRCVICHGPAVDVHHRLPRGRGGRNTLANVVTLCRSHHASVESRREWAYGEGLLVRTGVDPATVPVSLGDGGWFLLADDGSITEWEQTA